MSRLLIPLHNTLNGMASYRCYFLDAENHITGVTELEAGALAAAIDQALALLRERPKHHAIEIWRRAERLYASRREDS